MLAASPARAQPKSVLIEDLTWTEVRDAIAAGRTTAVYYAGSIEQNGPGVALGKHLFIAHYVAQRIAEELGNALMRFPGSVNVSDEAFGMIARGIAESARAAGFKNEVMMSDHGGGGQTSLEKVAKEQMRAYAAEHTIMVDSHAGFDDTSQIMFIDRENKWLRKDKLVKDDGKGGTGVNGDQTIATIELGRMFIGYKVKDAVDQIRSLVR